MLEANIHVGEFGLWKWNRSVPPRWQGGYFKAIPALTIVNGNADLLFLGVLQTQPSLPPIHIQPWFLIV